MTTVRDILTTAGWGSYYYEDVATLQKGGVAADERWHTPAQGPGFRFVRELAEIVSIGLVHASGTVHWGDCVGVSYAGKSGRAGPFRSAAGTADIAAQLTPWLRGRTVESFRSFCAELTAYNATLATPLHNALLYGASQAALALVSDERRSQPYQTIACEWSLSDQNLTPLPMQGSSGNNRYENADKMIVRRLAGLPHTQVDDIPAQLGAGGEALLAYAHWLRQRVAQLGGADYAPVIHLDVHGSVGKIFAGDVGRVAGYLGQLAAAVAPLPLRLESAVLMPTLTAQIDAYGALKRELKRQGIAVELVADEWANTLPDIEQFADSGVVDMIHIKTPDLGVLADVVDAVLHCRRRGMATLLGGSCIETDLSTRATIHVGMVTRPTALLAKPGMGIDEACMLAGNEMRRIAASSAIDYGHEPVGFSSSHASPL